MAWHYAAFYGRRDPTPGNPAYIYEIVIDDSVPLNLNLLDPTKEIVHILPQPLKGVVNPEYMKHILGGLGGQELQTPDIGLPFPHNVELQLIALAFAKRDEEMLLHGYIPPFCVKQRIEVEFSLFEHRYS